MMNAGVPHANNVTIARVRKGVVITAATIGSIALTFFCALLVYRRKLKQQQTVYPASHNVFSDGCWDADDSDNEDTDCSE